MTLLSVAAASAGAVPLDTGIRQTFGSQGYTGTRLYADFGGKFHAMPAYSYYRTDASSGIFQTVSLLVGYEFEAVSLSMSAGVTPKNSGYGNRFVGGEIYADAAPGVWDDRPWPAWLAKIGCGAGLTHTTHRDDLELAPAPHTAPRMPHPPLRGRPTTLTVGQADVDLSVDPTLWGNNVGISLRTSFYDQDLAAAAARAAQVVSLEGLAGTIQGFPRSSLDLRAERTLGAWTPMLSWTRTTFAISQPESHGFSFGARAALGRWRPRASYQRVWQSGEPDRQYLEFGLGARFD